MAMNLSEQLTGDRSPWDLRDKRDFSGKIIPFGCLVYFWEDRKRPDSIAGKMSPSSSQGVFLGYHIQAGHVWRDEYLRLHTSMLPEGDPNRKHKGRTCFQGNNVFDESSDYAIFAEMSSSPASMEAAKILDAYGSQPRHSKEQADARQAYTQAIFTGVPTWLRLPRTRWPKDWQRLYKDPLVPMLLALYGHPDSGGIWEKHFEDRIATKGWVPVLKEIWKSLFFNPSLNLLLVVYVDDLKMAGPTENMKKGWNSISSVIDIDDPEPYTVAISVANTKNRMVLN